MNVDKKIYVIRAEKRRKAMSVMYGKKKEESYKSICIDCPLEEGELLRLLELMFSKTFIREFFETTEADLFHKKNIKKPMRFTPKTTRAYNERKIKVYMRVYASDGDNQKLRYLKFYKICDQVLTPRDIIECVRIFLGGARGIKC